MGFKDPGLWISLTLGIGAIVSLVYRVKREKIHADRDLSLAELALRDTQPEQRREIIDGLAALRPFHAPVSRDADQDDETPVAVPVKLGRGRRR